MKVQEIPLAAVFLTTVGHNTLQPFLSGPCGLTAMILPRHERNVFL